MLHQRLVSALILIASLSILIALDALYSNDRTGGAWLFPAGLFFVIATSYEFGSLARQRYGVRPILVSIASGLVFALSTFPLLYSLAMGKVYPNDYPMGTFGWSVVANLLSMSFFALLLLRDFPRDPDHCLQRWALSSLIPTYVGVGASFWFYIRQIESTTWSLWALIGVIAITKISDAGAYFVGKAMGKRKLCPSISPGKTIEGAAGGIVSSIVFSIAWFSCLLPWCYQASQQPSHLLGAALFGLCIALVGMLGDLVESVVKRVAGAKDSGKTLPGLGGIWDVTDSILPTAVAGFLGIAAHLVWMPPQV